MIDNDSISGTKSISFDGEGEWKVLFQGYDSSGNKVGNPITRYITVGTDTSSSQGKPTISATTSLTKSIWNSCLGGINCFDFTVNKRINQIYFCKGNCSSDFKNIFNNSVMLGYYRPFLDSLIAFDVAYMISGQWYYRPIGITGLINDSVGYKVESGQKLSFVLADAKNNQVNGDSNINAYTSVITKTAQ